MPGRAARRSAVRGVGIAAVLSEGGRRGKRAGAHRHHLEQLTHAGRRHQALDPASISPARSGLAAISRAARSAMPKPPRNSAWVIGPSATRPDRARLVREATRIERGPSSRQCRAAQRVNVGVLMHGLQGIAIGRPSRAIVDEEGGEGRLAPWPAAVSSCILAGAQLEDGARRLAAACLRARSTLGPGANRRSPCASSSTTRSRHRRRETPAAGSAEHPGTRWQ